MGNRKAKGWRRVLAAGLVATTSFAVPIVQSAAAEVPDGRIMFIAAHPDDDIILAAGVLKTASDAGQDVKVAFITNGDEYDATIGTTRQNEGVAAQTELGIAESNLIFFGYPSTYLDCIRYNFPVSLCDGFDTLPSAVTYASRGLGGTDWHDYRTGDSAAFTQANVKSDLVALLTTYEPDEIFTHAYWDIHSDHRVTYLAVVEAIDAIPNYDPTVHVGLVHVDDPGYPTAWPDFSGGLPDASPSGSTTLAVTPTNEWGLLASDTNSELLWEQRESFAVPPSMLNSSSGSNTKYQAVAAHATQFNDTLNLIQRFIHSDEVFWSYKVGAPVGVVESYTVSEGASLAVAGTGVLRNDMRGTGTPPGAPVDPVPLGEMEASLVSGPSHGSLVSWPSDGSFTYVPDGSTATSDSFIYQPFQGSTYGAFTTVSITINRSDEDPTAGNDGPYNVANGDGLVVGAPGVLGDDTDPEGASLTAHLVADAMHGDLSLNSNGSFTYTHDGTNTLTDSFTYIAKDPGGNSSNVATVSITIDPATGGPLQVAVSGPAVGASGKVYGYTSSVSGGTPPLTYEWLVTHNGAAVADGEFASFSFVPASGGTYAVSLLVTDAAGSETASTTIRVLGDVAGSVFVDDIVWLADQGITKGCNPPFNDEFCPEAKVTRGQMAAFLVRFLGLTAIDPTISFTDTGGSVFANDALRLATAGITRGCNAAGDEFCPSALVTREQMAAFLVRALGLTDDGGGNTFVDDNDSLFQSEIAKLAEAGVTKGCNAAGDRFCPTGTVTRGQMAAFLHRADGLK